MAINYRVKLFYANWCGHCINFKPHWEKFKEFVQKDNLKDHMNNDLVFKIEDYAEGSNDMEFEKEKIMGYPTIIIYKNDAEREQYNGKPTFDGLLEHFDVQKNDFQKGGYTNNDTNNNYYDKYIKYKSKYLELKKSNNIM